MSMSKRCAIVGTAGSWRQTPWSDPTLEIWSLNDAYSLGFPRIDRHFDLHPIDKMWFKPAAQKLVYANEVPKGAFIRPAGHLEWLKQQAAAIPVYLQDSPPVDWPPNAHRFPIERVLEEYGDSYWASGPSYMLAMAAMEGYAEVWITGIHLSTEHEYREQRPQFEMLIGRLLGPKVKTSIKNGFRYYEGLITVVLPVESPVLQHAWKYAYESKPVAPENPYRDELRQAQKQKAKVIRAIVQLPAGQDKSALVETLSELEIVEMDCQQMLARANGNGTLTAQLPVQMGA
jgi:hypothetical protein